MVSYNELKRLYNELAAMSSYERKQNAHSAYQKLEELMEKSMGSFGGYFTTTRVACAFLAADGQLTMKEFNLFKDIAESSCTYDELYDTVVGVSKDFKGALSQVTTRGEEIRWNAGYLAAAIFAEKGYFGDNEETVLRYLSNG
jgi:hypothetical protein